MNQINANKRNSSEPWQIVMDSYYHPKLGLMDNVCVYGEHTMYINPDNLHSYIGYLNGSIIEIPETMDSVCNHELTHIYHDLMGENKFNKYELMELKDVIRRTPLEREHLPYSLTLINISRMGQKRSHVWL